eukprot:4186049-Amphidinium_carterae.1
MFLLRGLQHTAQSLFGHNACCDGVECNLKNQSKGQLSLRQHSLKSLQAGCVCKVRSLRCVLLKLEALHVDGHGKGHCIGMACFASGLVI